MDQVGRKRSILLNGLTMFAGSCLMAFARSFGAFCVGRVVTGLAVGGGLTIVPLYIAEVVPTHARGLPPVP